MRQINWRRVVVGGLLGGLVINVFEFFLNSILLRKDWTAAMRALGRPRAIRCRPNSGLHGMGFLHGYLCRLALRRNTAALWCRSENGSDCWFYCLVSGIPTGRCGTGGHATVPQAADAHRACGGLGGGRSRHNCRSLDLPGRHRTWRFNRSRKAVISRQTGCRDVRIQRREKVCVITR